MRQCRVTANTPRSTGCTAPAETLLRSGRVPVPDRTASGAPGELAVAARARPTASTSRPSPEVGRTPRRGSDRTPRRAALAEQIPALVEMLFEHAQPLAFGGIEWRVTGAVRVSEPLLLFHELADLVEQVLVVHWSLLAAGARRSRTQPGPAAIMPGDHPHRCSALAASTGMGTGSRIWRAIRHAPSWTPSWPGSICPGRCASTPTTTTCPRRGGTRSSSRERGGYDARVGASAACRRPPPQPPLTRCVCATTASTPSRKNEPRSRPAMMSDGQCTPR